MSLRVLFVCLSLCAIGLHAAWQIVQHYLAGGLYLDLCVFFFPIGIGLALGYRPSRAAADALFKLIYITLGVVLIGAAICPGALPARIAGLQGYPVLLVVGLLSSGVLALLHWLLYTPPFDDWLTRDRHEPANPRDPRIPGRTRG